ncbi:unnamed protein product, partial [Musa banksii]
WLGAQNPTFTFETTGGSPYSHQGSQDLMGQSRPPTPRVKPQSPLLFTPRIRMFPLQRHEEMHPPSDAWMPNSSWYGDVLYPGIPTMITWSHGGKEVFVQGSWDNWKTK